jgi:thioredoxin 2
MSAALQVVCPHCNAVNRLPAVRLGEGGQCGKCHQALFTAKPIELTSATIEPHIGRSDIPLVVDFWAPWCGPCRMMAPVFAQAAASLEPRVRFAKVNTEDQPALADRFAIRSIPTLALFKGGREVARQSGAMDLARLTQWVRAHS